MGEVKAKRDRVKRHEFRHDKHTVSLLTDHLIFSPKYRGKVLLGEVPEAAEEIVRETCKEHDIEVIDTMSKIIRGVVKGFKNKFVYKELFTIVDNYNKGGFS
ncbi:MAG: transposase [Halobacteriota archaeon]